MKAKVKCVELRTTDGKVLFVAHLYEKEVALEDHTEAPADKPDSKKESPKNGGQGREASMTDAQKRFLFRILAERGIGLIVISDDLPELLQNCDRILVMNGGRFVADLDASEATEEDIYHAMLASTSETVQ